MRTKFRWLANTRLTERNAEKIAAAGRKCRKIKNEGLKKIHKNKFGGIIWIWGVDNSPEKNAGCGLLLSIAKTLLIFLFVHSIIIIAGSEGKAFGRNVMLDKAAD